MRFQLEAALSYSHCSKEKNIALRSFLYNVFMSDENDPCAFILTPR